MKEKIFKLYFYGIKKKSFINYKILLLVKIFIFWGDVD